jgi:hypothetical protein
MRYPPNFSEILTNNALGRLHVTDVKVNFPLRELWADDAPVIDHHVVGHRERLKAERADEKYMEMLPCQYLEQVE